MEDIVHSIISWGLGTRFEVQKKWLMAIRNYRSAKADGTML